MIAVDSIQDGSAFWAAYGVICPLQGVGNLFSWCLLACLPAFKNVFSFTPFLLVYFSLLLPFPSFFSFFLFYTKGQTDDMQSCGAWAMQLKLN